MVAETISGGAAPIVICVMEISKALELTVPDHDGEGAVERDVASGGLHRMASSFSYFPTRALQ